MIRDLFCSIMVMIVGVIAGLIFIFFYKTTQEQIERLNHIGKTVERIDKRLDDNYFLINE